MTAFSMDSVHKDSTLMDFQGLLHGTPPSIYDFFTPRSTPLHVLPQLHSAIGAILPKVLVLAINKLAQWLGAVFPSLWLCVNVSK